MIYIHTYQSPAGMLTAASDGKAITGLWIEGQRYFPETSGENYVEKELALFKKLDEWLDCYFSGREPDFQIPLSLSGSTFRKLVWKLLSEIPYGQTTSYGEIAKEIERLRGGRKTSARAVGGAIGHNPASILVPCHRVIGSDGSLTGYAGGLERKKRLLALETMGKY